MANININESEIFKIIENYVQKVGIVQHQVESYNYFINEYLQRIFDEIPDIIIFPKKNEKYTVSFGQSYVDYPVIQDENRSNKLLLPYEARLRDLNYDSVISVDIRENLEDTEKNIVIFENYHPKTFISRVPVMINSCRCNIASFTKDERIAAGECEADPGGYFIVKGKERTLICQERINYNQIYVFEQKASSKFPYVAEIRSMSDETGHSVLLHCKISLDGKNVYFSLPSIKDDIPAKIVFKALNFSDEEIKKLIDISNIDPEIDELISSILRGNRDIRSRSEAITYIGRNPLNTVSDDKKDSYAEQVIDNELFPHLGNSNEKEKGVILGYMVNLLIKTYYKIRSEDDRDNLSLKRVEGPGTLIGDLFRMLLKRMIESAKKYLIKRQDILITLSRLTNVNNGLRHSFATGNWGIQKNNYIRNGVSQVLSRLSYAATISHLRRVVIPIGKEGKNTKIRQLHPTQIFFIDPVESPEGQQVGIVKNMALMTKISTGIPTIVVREIVDKCKTIIKLSDIDIVDIKNTNSQIREKDEVLFTKVFVNGVLTGYTKNSLELLKELKLYRKIGLLHREISISYDEFDNDIKVLSDDGRLIRPVFVVENGKLIVNNENYNKGWDYLIENGIVQYIDNNEVESSLIAMYPKDLVDYPEHTYKYTYCEIHPCLMLGVCTGDIIHSSHNQSPRNCYQTSMMKQALGLFATNFNQRVDTVTHILHYPQKPIVTTRFNKMLKYDQMPNGINAIVAIACYSSWNQEDSVIINKSAIDRGLFVSSCYKTITCEEKKRSSNAYETIEIPPVSIRKKEINYSKLGKNGIVPIGTPVFKNDVLIGKTMNKSYKDEEDDKTDCSLIVQTGYEGVIDKVHITTSSEGYKMIKIKIRSLRIPEIGDKVASRSAQKGTIGMIFNQEDMPFTDEGIVPDIIMNSLALPSRMTIAQLLECLQGKKCALLGEYADGTPFTEESYNPMEKIAEALGNAGFERYGNETMYNGFTGEPLKAKIFIGPTFYQRLKHLVSDKIHSRANGTVTMLHRQPAEGRSREGKFASVQVKVVLSGFALEQKVIFMIINLC